MIRHFKSDYSVLPYCVREKYLGRQFFEVKGNGKDGKIHSNKVFSEVSEAEVLFVGFTLSKLTGKSIVRP
jgi:hypothetical protein